MTPELMKECIRVSSHAANHAGHQFTDVKHQFFLTLALAGEVGELANMMKKAWRDDAWNLGINMELADIYIYLSLIAHIRGVDLDTQAAEKMKEVAKRPFAQAVT
jgi:NTP pyrophosphatase (non-canonical NTP hydrolase)